MLHPAQLTRQQSHKAFTLIELLVVISIIALLISILLPALSSAREAGKSIQCASNLRQIMIAEATYLNDHKWFTPPSLPADGATMPFNQHRWYTRLNGYLNSYETIQPGDPEGWTKWAEHEQTGAFECPTMQIQSLDTRSYSINEFGSGMGYDSASDSTWWGLKPFKRMNLIDTGKGMELTVRDDTLAERKHKMLPSDLMFISELGTFNGTNGVTHYSIRTGYAWEGTVHNTAPDFRHQGESKNVALLDGHVEAAKSGDFTYQTDRAR